MKPGNSIIILTIFFLNIHCLSSFAEDKILSTPLINLNELKPSFEVIENSESKEISNDLIKSKNKNTPKDNIPSAKFIGLDKITAKLQI